MKASTPRRRTPSKPTSTRGPESPGPRPRKAPKQARSRALVDALLEAAARILVRDGWGMLTTNGVAAEAGVSVGSLYQYYPDKDAIVAALVERVSSDMLDSLVEVGQQLRGRPLKAAARAIVQAALDATKKHADLHRALARELPRLGSLEVYDRMNRRLMDVLAEWIASDVRVHIEDPSLTAFAIVATLDALTDQALFLRPELLRSPRFVALLEQIVLSLLGHGSPTRRRRPVRGARARAERATNRSNGSRAERP